MSKKVLVALSGGVDSAVAAYILKEKGFEVSGIMLRLYDKESSTDYADALAVCGKLGIPLVYPDCRAEFKERVISRFADEYKAGRTPNPCVDCNRYVKLPLVFEYAEKNGFEYVATGHYARVIFDDAAGEYRLLRGEDRKKDQSYVLYNLTQKMLSHLLLPIGDVSKEEVREIAEREGFVNANKKDSQDICFIEGDYYEYLEKECSVTLTPGDFVDMEGRVLGTHKGAVCYTIGQRKGLGLALPQPMFVVSKDMEKNTVTLGLTEDLMQRDVLAKDVNIISEKEINFPFRATARVRYNQSDQPATIDITEDGLVKARFDEPQRAVTSGQSLVIYSDEVVLGGGKII